MKKILLPLFVLIALAGYMPKPSTELGDGNEFKQFIPEKGANEYVSAHII